MGIVMRKIISVFQRNYDGDRLIRDEIVPGAEWVPAGEGKATRKFDGTCCAVMGGRLYRRYDAKHGKTPPIGFISAQDPDPITGHWPGWLLVTDTSENKWHNVAFTNYCHLNPIKDGTYEACGPHFQSNPEGWLVDCLVPHGEEVLNIPELSFGGIREFLRPLDIEGIVFHHPDGRMAKVKKRDYGLKRK